MNFNCLKENYFDSNPNNLIFLKNLVEDSYSSICLDNIFSIFTSINEILYLIYSNNKKSIILYNLLNNQKISEIKNAHKDFILSFRHYLDRRNNIDWDSYPELKKDWDSHEYEKEDFEDYLKRPYRFFRNDCDEWVKGYNAKPKN